MVHQLIISLIGSEPEIRCSFKVKVDFGRPDMLEWLGVGFDPEYLNLDSINKILAKYKFLMNRKNPLVDNHANRSLTFEILTNTTWKKYTFADIFHYDEREFIK